MFPYDFHTSNSASEIFGKSLISNPSLNLTDGLKKQKLLLMLQECDEQEAAEILPAIEYLLALIHKRGNSNE